MWQCKGLNLGWFQIGTAARPGLPHQDFCMSAILLETGPHLASLVSLDYLLCLFLCLQTCMKWHYVALKLNIHIRIKPTVNKTLPHLRLACARQDCASCDQRCHRLDGKLVVSRWCTRKVWQGGFDLILPMQDAHPFWQITRRSLQRTHKAHRLTQVLYSTPGWTLEEAILNLCPLGLSAVVDTVLTSSSLTHESQHSKILFKTCWNRACHGIAQADNGV